MAPADAINDEQVNLFGSCLKEAAIVLTVVVGLVICVPSLLLFAGSLLNVGVLPLVLVHVESSQHSNDRLKEEQHVIEAVDFELLEEGPPQVFLVGKLLDEGTFLVDALKVFDDADFFATVDLFIVLKQFVHDLFEHALLCGVLRLRHESVVMSPCRLLLLLGVVSLQRLIVQNFLQDLELSLFFVIPLTFGLSRVDPEGGLASRYNVLCLPQEVE